MHYSPQWEMKHLEMIDHQLTAGTSVLWIQLKGQVLNLRKKSSKARRCYVKNNHLLDYTS